MEAFRKLQRVLGESTVQLLDTYDTLEGARHAAKLGRPLWGVRLDSGDFLALSRQVRAILDEAGLHDAKIMVERRSGRIPHPRPGAPPARPSTAFGVGTQLATSADAPAMSAIYKMVELDICGIKRFTAKYSDDKTSVPGAKQIFRDVAPRRDRALRRMRQRRGAAAAGDPGRPPGRAAAHARTGPRARRRIARQAARRLCDNWKWRSRGR